MATYRKIKDLSTLHPEDAKKVESRKAIWRIVALVLLAAVFFGAYWVTHPLLFVKKQVITVEIHHSDRYVETIKVATKKDFLLDALYDEKLVETEEGPDGLCIIAAGSSEMGQEKLTSEYTYWALLVGDEETDEDISQIPVRPGATYKIVFSQK